MPGSVKSSIYFVFTSFFLISCSAYHSHVIIYKIDKNSVRDPLLTQSDSSESSLYNWNIKRRSRGHTEKVIKFFAEYRGKGPVGEINQRALDFAMSERYFEAEIIFREALEEAPESPELYNNLGIVYEAQGNREKAFEMYSRACMLDDKNAVFRKNFISFDEYRKK